jgi:PAS domain S-box-containing protein
LFRQYLAQRKLAPGESREEPDVEPEVRAALAIRVERELARRSISGAMVYFVVTVILAIATPYYAEHPVLLGAVAALTFLCGGVRIAIARRIMVVPASTAFLKRAFLLATYATAAIWGLFCGWTVYLYGGDWTAMFLLLTTAALAGGASSSMAPYLRLASRSLILMFAPTVAAEFVRSDPRHLALAGLTILYLGYLMAQARDSWLSFWTATIAAEREKIRGSEDRRRAEAERTTLVAAIEQSGDAIVITDVAGDIRYCNPAFQQLTGYTREEAVGRNPRFLKSGKQDSDFYRSLWQTILNGGVWNGCWTNRRKDGSLYEVEGTISPIHNAAGSLTGFVAASRDITGRLRLEAELRQAQKMEVVGRLAGGIAHDFNNILTVIGGFGALLESQLPESDRRRDYAAEIRKGSERAANLTRQLLTFSRKQLVSLKPIDLNVLLAESRQMLQSLVGEDIRVTLQLESSLGTVLADPDQIHQIVMNLAANARDAMLHGGTLSIRTANVAGAKEFPSGAVLLSVADTGVGMDEEVQQHIFEPFFTTKARGRGTGLGLATVYGIVQQSEGRIEVRSENGNGTTFEIYLPRKAKVLEAQEQEREASAQPAPRGSETLLVVEDHDEVRQLMVKILGDCGYQILEAGSGQAALAQAESFEGAIDLLLTDIFLTDMTGKQVADCLSPQRPGMKVLFTSGYSGDVIAHRGVLDPDVEFLPKPFDPATLTAKVHDVLRQSGN